MKRYQKPICVSKNEKKCNLLSCLCDSWEVRWQRVQELMQTKREFKIWSKAFCNLINHPRKVKGNQTMLQHNCICEVVFTLLIILSLSWHRLCCRVEQEVTTRVEAIASNLKHTCLQKLSTDTQVALEEYAEMSVNCQNIELENAQLKEQNKRLRSTVYEQRIRLEINESLLSEMLKQLNRRLNKNRREADTQTMREQEKVTLPMLTF